MAWLEVETKVRIKDVEDMRKRVKKIANFVKREKRGDDYFAIKRKGYPKKAFRIRIARDEHVVNFKKWLKKYWDDYIVVKQEFEFKLKTKNQRAHFLELLEDLGFEQWVKKIKTSESYKYKKDKDVIIEINKVRHLGYFLEIEYLCKKWQMKMAKRKIRKVLKELGVTKKDIDNTGYTKMLWNRGIKDRKFYLKW